MPCSGTSHLMSSRSAQVVQTLFVAVLKTAAKKMKFASLIDIRELSQNETAPFCWRNLIDLLYRFRYSEIHTWSRNPER